MQGMQVQSRRRVQSPLQVASLIPSSEQTQDKPGHRRNTAGNFSTMYRKRKSIQETSYGPVFGDFCWMERQSERSSSAGVPETWEMAVKKDIIDSSAYW